MKITLWLDVHDQEPQHNPAIYSRMLETSALPHGDDEIVLYPWEDSPDDGPGAQPRRRTLAADGTWHIHLTKYLLNPNERGEPMLKAQDRDGRYKWSALSGENAAEFAERLARQGWVKIW